MLFKKLRDAIRGWRSVDIWENPAPHVPEPKAEDPLQAREEIGNGYLEFKLETPVGVRVVRLYGGPYRSKPRDLRGIKMAIEIDKPFWAQCPTVDFSVPDSCMMQRTLLQVWSAVLASKHDSEFYVGCLGGIGRTGVFLACWTKMVAEARRHNSLPMWDGCAPEHAIQYVRDHYYSRAVETEDQMKFVRDLNTTLLH